MMLNDSNEMMIGQETQRVNGLNAFALISRFDA